MMKTSSQSAAERPITINEKARLASMTAFWTFHNYVNSEKPHKIPISDEIDDILCDVLYAVGACVRAFRNKSNVYPLHALVKFLTPPFFSPTRAEME